VSDSKVLHLKPVLIQNKPDLADKFHTEFRELLEKYITDLGPGHILMVMELNKMGILDGIFYEDEAED